MSCRNAQRDRDNHSLSSSYLMTDLRNLELPIAGMDCAECAGHVRHAIAALPGVVSVDVYLASEKASIRLDPSQVSQDAIRTRWKGRDTASQHRTRPPSRLRPRPDPPAWPTAGGAVRRRAVRRGRG